MIGRGRTRLSVDFREIDTFLKTGKALEKPSEHEIKSTMINYISQLHDFYGERLGVRIARKHITWFSQCYPR